MIYSLLALLFFLRLCLASPHFFDSVNHLLGFGPNKFDMMHVINGMHATPDYKCRIALPMLSRPFSNLLISALPPLKTLLTENNEFAEQLSNEEQIELLQFYITHTSTQENLTGEALHSLLLILFREKAHDFILMGLQMKLFDLDSLNAFFLEHKAFLFEAIFAGLFQHFDLSVSEKIGKSILHVLAEDGDFETFKILFERKDERFVDAVATSSLTLIEKNSILHCAVLSSNYQLVSLLASNFKNLLKLKNAFGLSPFKMAVVKGFPLNIIISLLDEDELSTDFYRRSHVDDLEPMLSSLDQLALWASDESIVLREEIIKIIDKYADKSGQISNIWCVVIARSYRDFMNRLLRVAGKLYLGSPALSRSRSSSSLDSPKDTQKRLTFLFECLSEANFDSKVFGKESISVASFVEEIERLSIPNKSRIIANLFLMKSQLVFSGCSIIKFIETLLKFAEPTTFSEFVENFIGYDSCVRALLKSGKTYDTLRPYLEAIRFDPERPLADGSYPIHFSVRENNYNLMKFLIKEYNVDLLKKTAFESETVVHLLTDDSQPDLVSFLLSSASTDLLTSVNVFQQASIMKLLHQTQEFNRLRIFISCRNGFTKSPEGAINEDIAVVLKTLDGISNDSVHSDCKAQVIKLLEQSNSDEVKKIISSLVLKKVLSLLRNEGKKHFAMSVERFTMGFSPKSSQASLSIHGDLNSN